MSFDEWMLGVQRRTESTLEKLLPCADKAPARLHNAMRYSVLGGGKRVRPLLCHASGTMFSANIEALDMAAAAVELIHAYSLVHDDLPAMDNDVLRRGKPTCHIEFDEATALLVGDALQSLAFSTISIPIQGLDFDRQLRMVRQLATAAGSSGMAGGQAFDLQSVGKTLDLPELEFMHIHKTGALIEAAIQMGAYSGDATDEQMVQLSRFSHRIGLLFQVVDDILDAISDTATLGKTGGKDAENNKPTYVTLIGLPAAKAFAKDLRDDAHQALLPFGKSAQRLRELTDFIADREF